MIGIIFIFKWENWNKRRETDLRSYVLWVKELGSYPKSDWLTSQTAGIAVLESSTADSNSLLKPSSSYSLPPQHNVQFPWQTLPLFPTSLLCCSNIVCGTSALPCWFHTAMPFGPVPLSCIIFQLSSFSRKPPWQHQLGLPTYPIRSFFRAQLITVCGPHLAAACFCRPWAKKVFTF